MQTTVTSSNFQNAIEEVERLPVDDQLLLIEIIRQRMIQHRRGELITQVAEARAAYRTGDVRRGSVDDLMQVSTEERRQRMIAVKALYRAGEVEFLEPPPALAQTPVIVVFLDPARVEDVLAPTTEYLAAVDWGEPMDAEGSQILLALHEELAPYRIEATQAWDQDLEN